MATLVSPQIRWMADQYVNHCGYASAVLSGIAPDKRHLDDGGFHCSVEDLRRFGNAGDFSNTRPDDRNFNIQYGAAVDVSLSPADMRKHHARVHAVWQDHTDPRRRYINAINTWDGSGDAVRLDFVTNTAKYASPDHTWHAHDETRRRYLLDWTAVRAKVSVWRGDSKAQWLAAQQPDTVEEFVVATEAQVRAIIREELGKLVGPAVLDALETTRPYQASGPRKRLQDDRVAAGLTPWADQSVRTLLEYGFDAQVNGIGPLLQQLLAEVADDPAVPVTLDQAQITVLAEQVSARMPTAASVARAVNDDAAQRMQS